MEYKVRFVPLDSTVHKEPLKCYLALVVLMNLDQDHMNANLAQQDFTALIIQFCLSNVQSVITVMENQINQPNALQESLATPQSYYLAINVLHVLQESTVRMARLWAIAHLDFIVTLELTHQLRIQRSAQSATIA
jgi:hypothetical protein